MTPTQLSLRHLRAEGWTVDVCERWVPSGGGVGQIRKDLFGMLDLIAVRGAETMGVQTTSHSNALARVNKITDAEHAGALAALRAAGWSVVVHGWRLSTRDNHACSHGRPRCGCRWTMHRKMTIIEPLPLSGARVQAIVDAAQEFSVAMLAWRAQIERGESLNSNDDVSRRRAAAVATLLDTVRQLDGEAVAS